jgi:CheY-like chemotaxis protein
MRHSILLVDVSVYRDSIAKIFSDAGYQVEIGESAFEALSKLKAFDFDLVIAEVELPGDNAFDLYNYISTNYPYIPIIMTTEKNIDLFFDRIFREGIGNVLCKPLKKEELLHFADKLITKRNIFGIQNYLPEVEEIKKIRITSSVQIQRAIETSLQHIADWGFTIDNHMILNLVLNEMAINAVYHSHGFTSEKEQRKPVTLGEGRYVDIFFARNRNAFAFSINDYNGILSKETILGSINNVIEQSQILLRAMETGEDVNDFISETGRGIDLVRKLCSEYYFIIRKNHRTEIIMIFDRVFSRDDENYSSLKIIEDFSD